MKVCERAFVLNCMAAADQPVEIVAVVFQLTHMQPLWGLIWI